MAAPTLVSTTLVPSSSWGASNASATSPSIAVQTGDRIVVIGGGENSTSFLTGITDSAGNTPYTLVDNDRAGGVAYVFIATAVAATSTSLTVSLSSNMTPNWTGWVVYVFRGSSGVGSATLNGSSRGATVSEALTTTGNNSTVLWVAADYSAVTSTPVYETNFGTATEDAVHQGDGSHWGCRIIRHADAGTAQTSTFGILSGSVGADWNVTAIEVLGGAGGSTINGTATVTGAGTATATGATAIVAGTINATVTVNGG